MCNALGLPDGCAFFCGYNVANRLSQVRQYNPGTDVQTDYWGVTHDKNGNMLSYGSDSFSWNAWGQMTGSNQSGVSRQYKYDASGRLSSVQTGSSSTTPKQWLGWTDLGSGDPGLGLDNPLKGLGGKWNLTDSVGSVSGQVDPSTGAISSRQSFGPFGEEAASNAGASGFSGRDRVGNGILYFRNRMYSPLLGRFLSEDPIGFSGSPDGNFFAYCGNDPVNFTDPLGLFRMGWSNGGLWWGDDANHPSMWFGNMPRSGGGRGSYRCSGGGGDDEAPDASILGGYNLDPNESMAHSHYMDGKSPRSRWAHHAAGELGKVVVNSAVALGTAGVGLAGEAVAAVGAEAVGAAEGTVLYRGVREGHEMYELAQAGEAIPFGTDTSYLAARAHSAGNTWKSGFTSWTTDLSEAIGFAKNGETGRGVVLKATIPKSQIWGIGRGTENELLITGRVSGAGVHGY